MVATCSFLLALWTLSTEYCSSAHSLHSRAQGTKSPPETQEHGIKKKKKNPAWPPALGSPHRRWLADKRGASSRGLVPIGSKPTDKGSSSTVTFYQPTAQLPKASCHRGEKWKQPWICFVHRNKLTPHLSSDTWEREKKSWNKASLSDLYWQTTDFECRLFPVRIVKGGFTHLHKMPFIVGRKMNFYISCMPCLQIV